MVIEERIEIGGITSKDNLKKGSSIIYKDDIPSGFIMPKSGMLQVFYGYLTHYDGPMPWYSSLNTYFFKDDSTRTDELTPRFTDYIYWQRNFPFCNPSTRWEWNYFPGEEYLYDVDRVTEGDTVQFTYFSDWVASQDTFTYGVYSATEIWVDSQLVGWDMLFGNYDWCMEEFDNVLYISVGVIEEGVLDHFEVTIIPDTLSEKDTLAFAETARLYIQAKDSENNDIELPSDTLLTFKIETNETYGTFIDANGDTLKTTPVILNVITYGDANAGLIKFAAVKENPDSFVTCLVKVYLQEDTTKNGEREAVVLEQTLKIEIEEQEVQPIITSQMYDANSTTYLAAITVNNRKEFSVALTRGGEIIGNHKFKLSTNYLNSSGGHDHVSPRRPDEGGNPNLTERLKRQNYGSFYSYSSGPIFSTDSIKSSIEGETIMDSVCRFEYIASLWGDNMIIYLKSLDNELLKDSVSIEERIPDLQLLPNNVNYTKIGGTEEHHGPPLYINEDHNHYGTNNMIMHIIDIAVDYIQELPDEPLLNINDMSLPLGGKFDINGQWRGSHQGHRTGRNVDIRSRDMEGDRFLDANNNGIYDPDPVTNPNEVLLYDGNSNGLYDGETLEIFKSICEDNAASYVLLENPWNHNGYAEHWHLTF